MPIGEVWLCGLASLIVAWPSDSRSPLPSRSPSLPGGYARSDRRS